MEQYKIAIVSDTHGNWKKALEEMRKETGITHFVFLGDHAKDGEAIAGMLDIPSYIVRGNCDYSSDGVEEQIIQL
ncbi:MAG: metallophosphoesterase family protein, partial [Peptococcaceae bacterium]|nr:metallophosphoesterase family protein [Peptococcaceae bacterium]